MDNLGVHLKYKNPIRVMSDGEKLHLQKDAAKLGLVPNYIQGLGFLSGGMDLCHPGVVECALVLKTGVAYRLQENIAPEKFSPTYVLIGGYFIQDNRAKVMARRLSLVALLQKDYTEYAEELTARSPLI